MNTNAEYYMDNWFVEMDLVCANPVQTSFMITVRYIAYGLIGLFVFSIPDIFGRKWSLFVNFAL